MTEAEKLMGILNDPVYRAAEAAARASLVERWRQTQYGDIAGREKIWATMQAIAAVRIELGFALADARERPDGA